MARTGLQFLPVLLLMLIAMTEATPPGIAKNPSHASCKIKKYKMCYNLEHVCPKFCPDECTVNCVSCKPVCAGSSNPPPPEDTKPPPPNPTYPPSTASPKPPSPSPSPSVPTSPTPPTPSTTPSSPSPPRQPKPTPPSTPSSSPSPSSNPPYTPSAPPSSNPPPSSPSSSSSGAKRAKCKNNNYPQCYDMEHVCPRSCPGGCDVDCHLQTCLQSCQDPRFIGGDGVTFYFHGKKDRDFCLLSYYNLHINAHFIGRRNHNMKRDFTWVQCIGILFGTNQQLYIGAQKTAEWDDSVDRLNITLDGETISLPVSEGATWEWDQSVPRVLVVRDADTNSVVVEAEGSFRIKAKVVAITEEDSRIHNYGITKEDSFAHLDLGFKFFSLSDQASGVLGQTYRPDYATPLNIGAKMPVMGGDMEFMTSTLFAPDCAVARFRGSNASASI